MNGRERDVIATSQLDVPYAAAVDVDAVRRVEVRDQPDAVPAADLRVMARNRLVPEPVVAISRAPEDECGIGSFWKAELDRIHVFALPNDERGAYASPQTEECLDGPRREIEDEATKFVPRARAVGEIDARGERLEREVPVAPAPAERLRHPLPVCIRSPG